MSTPYGAPVSAQLDSGLPKGDLLGRFDSYLDAQKLVDFLADNNFPVANVSIVGNDLKMVERVTAKLSYPKVALSGAAQGALFGAFVGLILSLFGTGDILQILTSVVLGMAIWMIFGVLTYSMRRGKRDFSSSQQVLATSYDVVVAFEHAQAARALAAKLPMRGNFASQGGGFYNQPQAPQNPQAPQDPQSPQPPMSGMQGWQQNNQSATDVPPVQSSVDQQSEQQSTVSSSYKDLPDGRPQYGIRVTDTQQPQSQGQNQVPASSAEKAPPQTQRHAADETEESTGSAPSNDEKDTPENR